MKRIVESALVLLVTGLLARGSTGCSIIGHAIGSAADKPNAVDSVVTPARIGSIPGGEEVTVHLKSGYSVRGELEHPEARVYLVRAANFNEASDTLMNWTPIAGQRITVCNYSPPSVFFQGVTDHDYWISALNSKTQTVQYMTPKSFPESKRFMTLRNAVDSRQLKHTYRVFVAPEDSVAEIRWQMTPPATTRKNWPILATAGAVIDVAVCVWFALHPLGGL